MIKVGFDLDGVILYNPFRIFRRFIVKIANHKKSDKKLEFFIPKNKKEKFIWNLFHKSSLFLAKGFERIKVLKQQKLIEPYIVTARYKHLQKDLDKWLLKMDASSIFKGVYFNEKNEQPNIFKQKIIKQLDLSVYIEDNFDIVNFLVLDFYKKQSLVSLKQKDCDLKKIEKIYKNNKLLFIWIYNIVDRNIDFCPKVPDLNKSLDIVEYISKL